MHSLSPVIEDVAWARYTPAVDKERFKEFVGALAEKEVNNAPCPRCRSSQIPKNTVRHAILGESFVYLCAEQSPVTRTGLGTAGQPVAVILIACNQCGYIMTHAQDALGVSPPSSSG